MQKAACDPEKLPEAQLLHSAAPDAAVYLPAVQSEQLVDAVSVRKVPAEQRVQPVALALGW